MDISKDDVLKIADFVLKVSRQKIGETKVARMHPKVVANCQETL
jgi:hypothetical protein